MLCFELHRNGKRLATAGLPGKGVVSLIFDRVVSDAYGPEERRHFSLGGLDTTTQPNSSLHWVGGDVAVGDEFVVRFVDQETADRPRHRSPAKPRTKAAEKRLFLMNLRRIEKEAVDLRKRLGLRAKK